MNRRRLLLYLGSIVAACLIVLPLDLGAQGPKSLPARVSDRKSVV